MGLEFGHIPVRIRGIVFYTLTAFEQKCWIHFLSRSVPTGIRGVTKVTLQGLPGIVTSWVIVYHEIFNSSRYCNTKRQFGTSSIIPILVIAAGIWCVTWAPKAYKKSIRKDPTLYENDE